MTLPSPIKLLYVQILLGMALGMTVGHFWPQVGASLKPLCDALVALVRMLNAPIVFCTIVTGISSLSSGSKIGRTILKALALFYFLTIVALVLGLATAFALHPGAGLHIDARHLDTTVLAQYSTRSQSHRTHRIRVACDSGDARRRL